MRSSLFWRAFAAFLLLTLLTVTLCTGAMAAYLQAERQKSYETFKDSTEICRSTAPTT